MSLDQFVSALDDRQLSLVLVNRTAPRPVQTMLEEMFEGQPIAVDDEAVPEEADDVVYLVEDGRVVATSTLDSLQDTILLVNSDLYVTGDASAQSVDLPDVIGGLEDVSFTLRGYPESNKEKLLLVVISRFIEGRAIEHADGKLRAGFQRLSRIEDERGTRWVYETLADSPVDTHVYGAPDWAPPPAFDVTIHGGWNPEFRESWFVTFAPESDDGDPVALLALEREPREWEGFWTSDPDLVRDLNRYIEREL